MFVRESESVRMTKSVLPRKRGFPCQFAVSCFKCIPLLPEPPFPRLESVWIPDCKNRASGGGREEHNEQQSFQQQLIQMLDYSGYSYASFMKCTT